MCSVNAEIYAGGSLAAGVVSLTG